MLSPAGLAVAAALRRAAGLPVCPLLSCVPLCIIWQVWAEFIDWLVLEGTPVIIQFQLMTQTHIL